jgi:hypothetical protein
MVTTRLLRRSLLSFAAMLPALSPPAFAADFIFSSGLYSPGVTAPEPLVAGDVLQIRRQQVLQRCDLDQPVGSGELERRLALHAERRAHQQPSGVGRQERRHAGQQRRRHADL